MSGKQMFDKAASVGFAGDPPVRVSPDSLRALVEGILEKMGCASDERAEVADHLVESNLHGHDSHGVQMLPVYHAGIKSGRLLPNLAVFVTPQTSENFIVIDAFKKDPATGKEQHAFGQRAMCDSVNVAISRAKKNGICVLSCRKSGHIGRLGRFGTQVVNAGLAGIFFANVQDHKPLVAVHNGGESVCCTNPICIALPSEGGRRNFILDFATSKVAFGKIRDMVSKGMRQVQPGLFLDSTGRPSQDPMDLMQSPEGALMPFGEHKGSGLLVACELLAGALTGSRTLHPKHPLKCTPEDQSPVNSVVGFIFDPTLLGGDTSSAEERYEELDGFLSYLRGSRKFAENEPVLMPGDVERRTSALRTEHGIPVPKATWGKLVETATTLGVPQGLIAAAENSKVGGARL